MDDIELTDAERSAFASLSHFLTSDEEPDASGAALLERLEARAAERIVDGSVLLQRLSSSATIPTGCDALDDLLKGGLREGQVTEIYGLSTTGKTQLCHSVCASSLRSGRDVIYVDSTNSFIPSRLLRFLDPSLHHRLTSFRLHRLHDIYDLHRLMETQLPRMPNRPSPVVVVDSISALLSSVNNFESRMDTALIEATGRGFRQLTRGYGLAMLLTNQEVVKSDGRRRMDAVGMPALGHVWRNSVDVRVRLRMHDEVWREMEREDVRRFYRIEEDGIVTHRT